MKSPSWCLVSNLQTSDTALLHFATTPSYQGLAIFMAPQDQIHSRAQYSGDNLAAVAKLILKAGNTHLNSEGGSVQQTSLSSLVNNQLFQDNLRIFFHFQNKLVLTDKDKEVNRTDTSPFRIK